jgi:hypothetical protein
MYFNIVFWKFIYNLSSEMQSFLMKYSKLFLVNVGHSIELNKEKNPS